MEGLDEILTRLKSFELRLNTHEHRGSDLTRKLRPIEYQTFRLLPSATSTTVTTTVGGDIVMPITGFFVSATVYVDTAGVTGDTTIDINKNGTSILVNPLNISTATKTISTTYSSFGTNSFTEGDVLTVDVDAIATTAAKGLSLIIKYST